MTTMNQALAAKKAVTALLNGRDGIRGVGISWTTAGEPCVRVNVDVHLPNDELEKLPRRVDEVPIEIERRGHIHLETGPTKHARSL